MPRRRFFVPPENVQSNTARLTADQAHHVRHVLRVRAGDAVEVFDGMGNGYSGIVEIRGPEVYITSLERTKSGGELPLDLILVLALTRADRFEWALQKATELGAGEVIPVVTRYCEVSIPENRLETRMERWRKIVREASKQCRRFTIPRVGSPASFEEILKARSFQDATRLLFYERAVARFAGETLASSRVVVCIGPEGGWDAEEIRAAEAAGYQIFSLGPRVLRTETAAMAALAILQYCLGDLGPSRTNDE